MQALDDTTGKVLKGFIERIERLEQEKTLLNNDIKNILLEAKDKGFSPLIMRKVIRSRQMDEEKYLEQEALFELYKEAVE
jgi:uncharacterized protein (UPF0335 family)